MSAPTLYAVATVLLSLCFFYNHSLLAKSINDTEFQDLLCNGTNDSLYCPNSVLSATPAESGQNVSIVLDVVHEDGQNVSIELGATHEDELNVSAPPFAGGPFNLEEEGDYYDDNETETQDYFEENVDGYSSRKPTFCGAACRETRKNVRIAGIQQTILSMLKMSSAPNISKDSVPTFPTLNRLIKEYNKLEGMLSDQPYDTSVREDIDEDEVTETKTMFQGAVTDVTQIQLDFNISHYAYIHPPNIEPEMVASADLWVYLKKPRVGEKKFQINIQVLYILVEESYKYRKLVTEIIHSEDVWSDKVGGWRKFKFTSVLKKELKNRNTYGGLQLRADDGHGNNLLVHKATDTKQKPWLEIKIHKSKGKRRQKRSDTLICGEHTSETRCCRYPLYVSFAEFGWEWIIAPTHVKADYCSGECRMTMQDSTPNSWINQQVGRQTGGPCCAPTKMSALPLLYFNNNMTIVYQILQNMKVEKCGCA
ncbi:growth/differentiation factor 8-like [Physella acuta]|uniref:growth/differentiation factor 8-like n=1 Tax=Physella acuta TaxID=109671 RepID=UPI0027DBDB4A|nr:growth/differentiation factor 8-like [Physella acuta]